MAKLYKAYNNEMLIEALKDRDETIQSIENEMDVDFDQYSDDEKHLFKKYLQLSQFEKDLLYLASKMSVRDIAVLYGVSATHIYSHLNQLKKRLKE